MPIYPFEVIGFPFAVRDAEGAGKTDLPPCAGDIANEEIPVDGNVSRINYVGRAAAAKPSGSGRPDGETRNILRRTDHFQEEESPQETRQEEHHRFDEELIVNQARRHRCPMIDSGPRQRFLG
jgi:hypothetical protein